VDFTCEACKLRLQRHSLPSLQNKKTYPLYKRRSKRETSAMRNEFWSSSEDAKLSLNIFLKDVGFFQIYLEFALFIGTYNFHFFLRSFSTINIRQLLSIGCNSFPLSSSRDIFRGNSLVFNLGYISNFLVT
jgi:hypothetical protein